MTSDQRKKLSEIKQFKQLIAYLRDEMGWPINSESAFDELTYEYTTTELGIDDKSAAQIQEIKRLRPLSAKQPWGVFFVKFEPKKLPVVALRRILGQVALKRRASANPADRTMWAQEDLLFISNYGEGDDRQITLAHFSVPTGGHTLPSLKVLGWDSKDTVLHLEAVARELTEQLSWPADESDVDAWRAKWRAAFTVGHQEVITTSKALSIRLAQLARDIRDRIETALKIETDDGPLTRLMKAFRESLIHDLTPADFADMYAQTIAYGLLSSRIADPKKNSVDDLASHMQLSPFLKELMETFLQVGGRNKHTGIDFDELGVGEVVELLDSANMEAVIADFGDKNSAEDPVIHFYELFLKEYDEKIRKSRGVFYTPRPIVSYIVRTADNLLRSEFGLHDGLADTTTWGEMAKRHAGLKIPNGINPTQEFVQILDPATGTGTFLVECIDLIHKSLTSRWNAEGKSDEQISKLWNEYVPNHLLGRLQGYELLMAPYAIAHLKLRLKLYETGYKFGSKERARVYLTNALEPAEDFSGQFAFSLPALARESSAVNTAKATSHFTVVIGNPPYAGHSLNNDVAWIVDKVYDYKRGYPGLQKRGQAKWLQDDYVKFLRLAEWHISQSDYGLVGFITNNSWLDNPTFKGMRQQLLDCFDQISILDLHGSANKKERALDGGVDKNVFDIKQGVAISMLRRTPVDKPIDRGSINRSDLFGTKAAKYSTLSSSSHTAIESVQCWPRPPDFTFVNSDKNVQDEYDQFYSIPELFSENGDAAPGVVTTHDAFAISFSKAEQVSKVQKLLQTKNEAEARRQFVLCSQAQWSYNHAIRELRSNSWENEITPVLYRPFDIRYTVYNRHVAVHRRERVSGHLLDGSNIALLAARQSTPQGVIQAFVSNFITEAHAVTSATSITSVFPLWLNPEGYETERRANLSPILIDQLSKSIACKWVIPALTEKLDGHGNLTSTFGPQDVFNYTYAVLFSDAYRKRYAEFLRNDFARIPMSPSLPIFRELAEIGSELVNMHSMRKAVGGSNTKRFIIGNVREVEKISWAKNIIWLDKSCTIGFNGVNEDVWNYYIGGYQVCKKWLDDRRKAGIKLSDEDIELYQQIVLVVGETIRLAKVIDRTIIKHGGWPEAFSVKSVMA
jgi:predicted helicase